MNWLLAGLLAEGAEAQRHRARAVLLNPRCETMYGPSS